MKGFGWITTVKIQNLKEMIACNEQRRPSVFPGLAFGDQGEKRAVLRKESRRIQSYTLRKVFSITERSTGHSLKDLPPPHKVNVIDNILGSGPPATVLTLFSASAALAFSCVSFSCKLLCCFVAWECFSNSSSSSFTFWRLSSH